ncbi:hypothetical protein P4H42_21935 [Paenibacillus macerans]|uniref:hypothetical protein n=1 Tax=Paenibacillus macerans TaxID=44252 RepID=UPI002DB59FEA|nr:hypothetical protein [Paenibacillus macerans]MEC0332262.1 hypothetical protein [Paenibacillus macerans]
MLASFLHLNKELAPFSDKALQVRAKDMGWDRDGQTTVAGNNGKLRRYFRDFVPRSQDSGTFRPYWGLNLKKKPFPAHFQKIAVKSSANIAGPPISVGDNALFYLYFPRFRKKDRTGGLVELKLSPWALRSFSITALPRRLGGVHPDF